MVSCHNSRCEDMRKCAESIGHSHCVCYNSSYLEFADQYLNAIEIFAWNARKHFVITCDRGEFGKTQKEEMTKMGLMGINYEIATFSEYLHRYWQVDATIWNVK